MGDETLYQELPPTHPQRHKYVRTHSLIEKGYFILLKKNLFKKWSLGKFISIYLDEMATVIATFTII